MAILQHQQNESQRLTTTTTTTTTNSRNEEKKNANKSRSSSIRFSPKVNVRKFRDTVTATEAKDVWYDQNDYDSFRNDTKECIRLVQTRSTNLLNDIIYCSRGAECRTTDRLKARSSARTKALNAVMDEQERQWDSSTESSSTTFIYDDEAIAQLYYRCTLASRRQAQLVGLSDAQAAAAIQTETAVSCTYEALASETVGRSIPIDVIERRVVVCASA
jgi:hypothetical protein